MQQIGAESAAHRLQGLSISQEETDHAANETPATEDPSIYEETHVHSVYESIADHFSATRYAPWPLVARFLEAQPAGSIGLDVGCGNGKYLSGSTGNPDATPNLFILGSDRSSGLAKLAHEKHARRRLGADVLLADSLALPFRDRCADFIICIAVVHHLSTRQRRQEAIKELLRCVRPRQGAPSPLSSGSVLVYVWALEQASSRRGWASGGDQDLLVPWVKTMKDRSKEGAKSEARSHSSKGASKKKQRKQRQAIEEPQQQQQPQSQQPQEPPESQTLDILASGSAQGPAPGPTEDERAKQEPFLPPTFHRYYHLYREGELEEDVAAVGGRVVASGYERDNWWVVTDAI